MTFPEENKDFSWAELVEDKVINNQLSFKEYMSL